MRGERMRRRLQPHDDTDRPRADLRVGEPPGLAHAVDLVERLAPQLGLGVDLHQQARQRPAGERGRCLQRFELARPEVGIDLQHAAARALHAGGDAQKLGLAGAERGREAAVLGLVLGGARGREAHRAGAQGLLGEARHLLDLALARHLGMVGAAIAHDVEAQRAVRQLGRDIDGPAHRRQRVEIVGEGFPVEFHAFVQHRAGNVLDAFHQVDQVGRLARPHRREADAAIAEHRGRDAMPRGGRDERVPGRLAVIVGVDVDEARRDHQARRIDLAPALARAWGRRRRSCRPARRHRPRGAVRRCRRRRFRFG